MAEQTVATPEVQKANITESTRNQERYVVSSTEFLTRRAPVMSLFSARHFYLVEQLGDIH